MKLGILTSVLVTGAAAAAIAAAPAAGAANPVTVDRGGEGNATVTQRQGHVNIAVTPPDVSDARSYGEFTSPAPLID
jgi:hypothetical protein